jgi:hypothetical protein
MRNKLFWLALLVVALLLSVSAFGGENYKVKRGEQIPDAEVEAGKALVYVIRPQFAGKAVRVWTFVDKDPVVVTHGKQGSYVYVDPGKHIIWSKAENVDASEMELEAGEAYYVQQKVKVGFNKARSKVIILSEAEGKELIKKCAWVELSDAGRNRGEEIVSKKWEVVQKKLAKKK